MTYGTQQLLEEVSYVAYHFHWPMAEILDLEHPLRREFVAQIGTINERLNEQSAAASGAFGESAAEVAQRPRLDLPPGW
ncbi:DUF6760 family protein [Kitasatospora sp. NPDC049285]|uniref:DUF6760 family protein n=1 Tax=Kitasatospora sp. NPDC049285 TaxID=3157096 RepID=UPI00344409CC